MIIFSDLCCLLFLLFSCIHSNLVDGELFQYRICSHDMFRKLWPHIHSDNSSVPEVRCLFWVFHLVAEENAGKEKRKQLFQFVLFLFFLCKIWFLIATFEVRKGMFLIMEYTRIIFFFFLSIRITSF